ncbi:MAG: hypothetical protein ACP5NZ_04260 [Nanobdellota archaeon]
MKKRGQFYLVATIIIVAVLIGLAATLNYSTKKSSYEAEEIAKELKIEGEKVLDYDANTGSDRFEDFANDYSYYVGEDKDIYFIVVDKSTGFQDAFMYTEGQRVDLGSNLIVNNEVTFRYNNQNYEFKLEEGKAFYFIVVYDKGGDTYVLTG